MLLQLTQVFVLERWSKRSDNIPRAWIVPCVFVYETILMCSQVPEMCVYMYVSTNMYSYICKYMSGVYMYLDIHV